MAARTMEAAGGEGFVRWEEVVASGEKGRRVVHYYLESSCGRRILAVVGKERSVRHMSYAVPDDFLLRFSSSSSPSSSSSSSSFSLKWRSRREVIDWLSSLVSPDSLSHGSTPLVDTFLNDEEHGPANILAFKGLSSRKMKNHSKEFSWLGSPWTCRKRRKHYTSFCRGGVKISVHDFVYVMSEENKRLVAYVDDLYEDIKANNMVSVRWFHKVDEVGIVLPHDVIDREIFFSLSLQDLSVECIDELAAVLGTQHFEKYLKEATYSPWEPYLCRRQIDNNDVKAFDVTLVKGYWNQEILKCIYRSSTKIKLKLTSGRSRFDGNKNGSVPHHRPRRKNWSNSGVNEASKTVKDKSRLVSVPGGADRHIQDYGPVSSSRGKEVIRQKLQEQLSLGSHIEVLSQDSGIRGCWFRCVILKRYQDKVKVRYLDVQDADGTGYLEEWILALRLAVADELGLRLYGRSIVRPSPSSKSSVLSIADAGAVVDAWWNDAWWEGIIIQKESDCKIHVYFPGERRFCVFGLADLRPSREWVCSKWYRLKDRPDLVSSLLLLDQVPENCGKYYNESCIPIPSFPFKGYKHPATDTCRGSMAAENAAMKTSYDFQMQEKEVEVPNLVKDDLLARLRWRSSKKRLRAREPSASGGIERKRHCDGSGSCSSSRDDDAEEEPSGCVQFSVPKKPLIVVDRGNWKFVGREPLITTAPMPLLPSNLVTSQ